MLGIEIDAVLDVADEGVVGPAVPEAGDDVEELAGAAVALAMLHMLVQAEIQRRVGVGGGDQVPAGAPAADMVERGESARDRDRARSKVVDAVAIRPRCSVTTASAGSSVSGSNEVDGGAALQRLHRHVQHGQMIGHEEGVEPAALQRLGEAHQMREVEIGVGEGAGIAPGGGVDARPGA